jgi:hypothetical protein
LFIVQLNQYQGTGKNDLPMSRLAGGGFTVRDTTAERQGRKKGLYNLSHGFAGWFHDTPFHAGSVPAIVNPKAAAQWNGSLILG